MDTSSLANDLAKSLFHVGHSTFAKVIDTMIDDSGQMNIWIIIPHPFGGGN